MLLWLIELALTNVIDLDLTNEFSPYPISSKLSSLYNIFIILSRLCTTI